VQHPDLRLVCRRQQQPIILQQQRQRWEGSELVGLCPRGGGGFISIFASFVVVIQLPI
jgi:hypothetical protein